MIVSLDSSRHSGRLSLRLNHSGCCLLLHIWTSSRHCLQYPEHQRHGSKEPKDIAATKQLHGVQLKSF